jgi:CDGSH-type Zn-finger protein
MFNGNLSIRAVSGQVAWQRDRAVLCRCDGSKNEPFCDYSHKRNGFVSD